MAVPVTVDEFLDLVRKSGVADEKRFDAYVQRARTAMPAEPAKVAGQLVQDGILTNFQAENILAGKWRRFTIGKYKILEKLGAGGMAQVYLCEHKLMRRRVAVKVLPVAKAKESSALERFRREARAAASLDHPNLVHAFDFDQDAELHFIVMEYVDGSNLQDIVKTSGPLSVPRACLYIRQTAFALEHAHDAGLIHRDIKPGNILVDRAGVVKLLDMGLALIFTEEDECLTEKHEDGTLGTADYLSPEQALDSHDVDIRTDIYSLGVTFYFLLTGQAPFEGLPVTQKLLAHQLKIPKPITAFRKDVSAEVLAIIDKMMAKKAADRYAVPGDVADALEPFTQETIAPPSTAEMPKLSPAAGGESPPAKASAPRADTNAPTAQTDSAPLNSSQAKNNQSVLPAPRQPVLIGMVLFALVVIPICLASVLGGVWVFWPKKQTPDPSGPPKLEVGKERAGGSATIHIALKKAEIGSVIELWDDIHDENVTIDEKLTQTAITIQAAPGKSILWRSARGDPDQPIIRLSRAVDFKLKGKGITLDGGRKVKDLIMITSDCAGLSVEDLELKGFARSGILIVNAAGRSSTPIKLTRLTLHLDAAETLRGGIYFDANPQVLPKVNDHIVIDAAEFRGAEAAKDIQFNTALKQSELFGENVRWAGR